MKALFAIVLAVLLAASFFTWRSLPDMSSDVPVLYWVTDGNPMRIEQIRTFRQWLARHGYPDFEVRIDPTNTGPEKILVQGVSGVAADLIDHTAGSALRLLQAVGMLVDVTEDAQRLGFDTSKTYASLKDDLTVAGHQYAYPSNVSADALWVNVEAFERVGMVPPPRQWTVEEFERLGKEYTKRANGGNTGGNSAGKMQRYFFVGWIDAVLLAATMGGALYNETQSACMIDSPAFRRALGLRYKWMFEDRLMPTAADWGTFTTGSGASGVPFGMFEKGNIAMVRSGRWSVIHLRRFADERRAEGREMLKFAVSEDPHGGFRVSFAHTRACAVYVGGHHKDLAMYFLAFLTSEEYNMAIVRSGDALPSNPKFLKTEEFLHPADRPEEWRHPWGSVHGVFGDLMEEIVIAPEFSPFVLDTVAIRYINSTTDRYMNNMLSVEEATATMQRLINAEIQRELAEDPCKLPLYNERVEMQKRIDALKARGEKVPLSWISNGYWRRYYVQHGLADEMR